MYNYKSILAVNLFVAYRVHVDPMVGTLATGSIVDPMVGTLVTGSIVDPMVGTLITGSIVDPMVGTLATGSIHILCSSLKVARL